MVDHLLLGIVLALVSVLGIFELNRRNMATWESWAEENLVLGNRFLDSYTEMEKVKLEDKTYHFVHHTHTDSGWIETMGVYSTLYVDSIIANTSKYLMDHPDSRVSKFSYTNMDYPWDFKKRFPELWATFVESVKTGRMRMLNDGIVMPDQALPYFDDLINVYEYGREFGLKEFGNMTRIGWHVDTFGQSSSMTSILADMGYDYQGVNRIFLPTRERLEHTGDFMINWKQSYPHLDLPTYVLPFHYAQLVYDYSRMRGEAQMDLNILDVAYEGIHMTHEFYAWMHGTGQMVNWQNVIVMMGDDFLWFNAEFCFEVFKGIYIQLQSNSKSLYPGTFKVSHVDEAFAAIKSENLPLKDYEGDFFPMVGYHQRDGMVAWTGFFYEKPSFKYRIKEISVVVRGLTNLLAYLNLTGQAKANVDMASLQDARFFTGIMMHHDAITGTCMTNVVKDYYRMILDAERQANTAAAPALFQFSGRPVYILANLTIKLDNFSVLPKSFLLINQESPGLKTIRIEVPRSMAPFVKVENSSGGDVSRIVCTEFLCDLSVETYFSSFQFQELKISLQERPVRNLQTTPGIKKGVFECSTNSIRVGQVEVSLGYYMSSNAVYLDRLVYQLGSYVLRTFYSRPKLAKLESCVWHQNTDGSISVSAISENPVAQTLNVLISKVNSTDEYRMEEVRVDTDEIRIIEDIELILVYKHHSIKSHGTFYTDSNGLRFEKRVYNHNLRTEVNHFPISRMMQIIDPISQEKFTVLPDRAQGGTSPEDGVLEIGYQRGTLSRDYMGLADISLDNNPVTVRHTLYHHRGGDGDLRGFQAVTDAPVLIGELKDNSHSTASQHRDTRKMTKAALSTPAYIRTLLDVRDHGIMFRVYNMHDTETFTIPNIREFVKQRYGLEKDVKLEERSLDFNQPIETILNQPYLWRNVTALKKAHEETVQGDKIILRPLTMKTFRISA